MEFEEFETRLAALLRSAGPQTVAELTDTTVAWWNGTRVVYANVDESGNSAMIGPQALDARHWPEWKDWLSDWLTDPVLSVRHDLPHEP
ncbi:hypothetical protein PPGU19_100270 (plasmid) [Paraburkholderia sp. PGU19]|uniref:hypothetical protein n=1 Tax=Paraburkholderia sp. PGU19 TaxID=2735434 RepID=UPI0015DA10DF|nr:hypothetical protein [Paraburkholderia sp. PGU19]BCG05459.1 hypothetical protein PPGU19_100270 [Paraburkholderia sp. PGU19]